ncbi:MAG: DUF4147 domain-containing protein [Patescibacteria group bacterium]|nr:DUF4147 domain-containing protein [Patescibacteria group bacterium]
MTATRTVRNADSLATTTLRSDALDIIEAGYEAINTKSAIARKVRLDGDILVANDIRVSVHGRRIFFVGVGKCAAAAAEALEGILGERITGGIALDVAMPPLCKTERIECILGTHPAPSEINESGTKRIMEMLSVLEEGDLAIILVSGGGSTLLCSPTGALTCTSEKTLLGELFRRGATIQEINTLRKHISHARGGGLAKAAYPAEVLGLVISDVPGHDLSFIASGPTVRDETTVADAAAMVKAHGLSGISESDLIETPNDEKYFARVHNTLLISNRDALEAMKRMASERGYSAEIVTDELTGEARDAAREVLARLRSASAKSAHLYGGETTVAVGSYDGIGGRCQEFALALVDDVAEGEVVVPFASDGRDNSAAAGAIADTVSASHAVKLGISAGVYLQKHRSYDFFRATGDALETGYTGSNVSDLIVALKAQ